MRILNAFKINMDYVLVGDDCSDCSYVANAFTLLRLPCNKIQIDDIHSARISHSLAVFVCKNIYTKHLDHFSKLALENEIKFISWESDKSSSASKNNIHFLKMPFSKDDFQIALAKCSKHKMETLDLNVPILERLVGQSASMTYIKSLIIQVASSDTTVLILGQSGTGKDIIANCIHQLSSRHNHSFVPINCGAIPSELMESELFGHEKGAFTGAVTRKPGRFEIANSGTLFLDEIGDMPLPMQVKLLRVIQDRKIERVGGNASIDINTRLIAATHKNLEELINQNQFREDLYYRLNVFPITVPKLSERKEDIPLLIDFQVNKIQERLKHRIEFTPRAIQTLCNYAWPGNIRELQNFLERMVILYPDHVIDEKHIDLLHKKKFKKHNASHQMKLFESSEA